MMLYFIGVGLLVVIGVIVWLWKLLKCGLFMLYSMRLVVCLILSVLIVFSLSMWVLFCVF